MYSGCEDPKILSWKSYLCPEGNGQSSNKWCRVFWANNILTLDTDSWSNDFADSATFWLAEPKKAGKEQGFIMDLGCVTAVEGVSFRNTHNRQFRDRSTRKFKLLGSSEQNGPWSELLLAHLVDSRNQDVPPVETRTFVSSTVVRYIKFELLAFWGNGGGLQYFKVITGRPKGTLLATGLSISWRCESWLNHPTWLKLKKFASIDVFERILILRLSVHFTL